MEKIVVSKQASCDGPSKTSRNFFWNSNHPSITPNSLHLNALTFKMVLCLDNIQQFEKSIFFRICLPVCTLFIWQSLCCVFSNFNLLPSTKEKEIYGTANEIEAIFINFPLSFYFFKSVWKLRFKMRVKNWDLLLLILAMASTVFGSKHFLPGIVLHQFPFVGSEWHMLLFRSPEFS